MTVNEEGAYGYWPENMGELVAYISKKNEEMNAFIAEHGYGDKGYNKAPEIAADMVVATFNYAGHALGLSGFQASHVGLLVLQKTRGIEGPFGILDSEKFMYPQYDAFQIVREWRQNWGPAMGKLVREKMATSNPDYVHPVVWAHWEALSAEFPNDPDNS